MLCSKKYKFLTQGETVEAISSRTIYLVVGVPVQHNDYTAEGTQNQPFLCMCISSCTMRW